MEEVEEEDGYIKRGRELRGVIGENLVKLYNPRWNQRTECRRLAHAAPIEWIPP